MVRPKPGRLRDAAAYAKALTAAEAPHEDARLVDFDVVFLRNNPNAGAAEADTFNPAIDFGRRLKQLGVLVVNDPDGLSRAGSKMYLAGFPGRAAPEDPHHPLGRAGAGRSCASSTARPSSSRWPASAARTSSTWRAGRRPTWRR